jgi:hypothetical protein
MKRLLLCSALLCVSALQAQNLFRGVTSSLTVRHLHQGGWSSHVLKLELTAESLLLTGPQQYPVSGNVMGYCVFPAEIPLERIVKVEAKPEGLASGLKLFSATSNSFKILKLHLDYLDDRGRMHSFDFIPGDAQQSNNEWLGGNQEAVKDFAVTVKYAADLRVQELKAASAPSAPIITAPDLVDPDTGEKLDTPDSVSEMTNIAANTSAAGSVPLTPAAPVSYKAQMPWSDLVHQVDVWPISPVDHARLRVEDKETGNPLIDVPLERIVRVDVRQRRVNLIAPTPGVITLSLDPGYGPKVYELCLHMITVGTKQVTNCFVSDLAQCVRGAQCQEGSDGGRNILSLEDEINKAIASRAEDLKRARN